MNSNLSGNVSVDLAPLGKIVESFASVSSNNLIPILQQIQTAYGYLPKGVPLMKRILAVSGQTVCRSNLTITVDGVEVGAALERDRAGRDLPVWQGCRRVQTGEVFLMNWQVRDSLDGRYFGPLPATAVIGRATPLYTDEDGDGRFVWRAPTR